MSTSTAAQEILAKLTPNFLGYLTGIAEKTSRKLDFEVTSGAMFRESVRKDITINVIIDGTPRGKLMVDQSDGTNPYGTMKYEGKLFDDKELELRLVPHADIHPALGIGHIRGDSHKEIPFP